MAFFTLPTLFKAGMAYLQYKGAKNANNQNYSLQQQALNNPLGPRIEEGKKYGIHPLMAIGASPGPMPTVPMQNPLGGLNQLSNMLTQDNHQDSIIDTQLKHYALQEAKDRAYDRQFEYELLIPVRHKDYPEKTMWAFNSRYLSYGTFPTLITMAANKELALKELSKSLTPDEQSKLGKLKEFLDGKKSRTEGLSPLHKQFIDEGGLNTYKGKIRR